MKIEHASRLNHFQTGIFAALDQKKQELIDNGKKIYNLSIGTPDFETPEHIRQALSDAAKDPKNWVYSLKDIPELLNAVVDYYQKRFDVELKTDEIMSVNGSQEGIGHIGMALCNPGDIVLLPNPGYPIFEAGSYLGEAKLYFYSLKEENGFLPDFSEIPDEIADKAKFIIVSYPLNPVCATAPKEMYEELIKFAKKHNIIVIHDNAYSDIIFDREQGFSFLSIEGAKDVGVEFFSLSKSFNTTGARISFMVGNKEVVNSLKLLRSQFDFGMFLPIQYAAIAALKGPLDGVKKQCEIYKQRRDALCGGLRSIGWNVKDTSGTMFVWAKIPPKFKTTAEFCMELMDKTGVICTPGDSFGSLGEGYVRFALVVPVEKIQEIVKVIDESGILKQNKFN